MGGIRDFVAAEPLFETHGHHRGFSGNKWEEMGCEELLGYATADFASAAGKEWDQIRKAGEIFDVWPYVRTTGYGQAVEMASQELFGLAYTARNAGKITAAVREMVRTKTPIEIYEDLFRRAGVRWTVVDLCWHSPTHLDVFGGKDHLEISRFALRADAALTVSTRADVEKLEAELGRPIRRLADLDEGLDEHARKAHAAGRLVAIKIGVAYSRRLDFDEAGEAEAEKAFSDIMRGAEADKKPLHDYQFHRMVRRARELDLPVQIHTGYLAGSWGDPSYGDPAPLVDVFRRYKDVRFDVFHASWPYSELVGAIAKACPNVWVDLCWAWAMSPAQMERILDEWLGEVPCNKIFGFGGDTGSPLAFLGYALQARRGIARALERKVERGEYDLATAEFVARRVMHENAREFFKM